MTTFKRRASVTFTPIPFYLIGIFVVLAIIGGSLFLKRNNEEITLRQIENIEDSIEEASKNLSGLYTSNTTYESLIKIRDETNKLTKATKYEISDTGNYLVTDIVDPWGSQYCVFLKNTSGSNGEAFVLSLGKDKELFTSDDIACSMIYLSTSDGNIIKKTENVFIDGCNTVGHDYTEKIQSPVYLKNTASCQSGYVYYYACSICYGRGSESYEVGEKYDHKFEERFARTEYLDHASNCTECAEYFYKCIYCDLKGEETFEFGVPYGHEFTEKIEAFEYIAVPGTCYSKQKYYYKCANCDEYGDEMFEAENVFEHKFVNTNISDDYLVSHATCSSKAIYYESCKYCGLINYDKTFEYGDALGHDYSMTICDGYHLANSVNCNEVGSFYYACSRCGEVGNNTFEGVLKHNYTIMVPSDDYKASDATCIEPERYYYKCERCGEKSNETYQFGNVLEHDMSGMVVKPEYLVFDATCTSKAVYYYSCTMCGGIDGSTFENGSILSHTPNGSPSCTESQFCIVCGAILMNPVSHSFDTRFPVAEYLYQAATCKEKAVYYYKCNYCDEHGARTYSYGKTTDHDYVVIEEKDASCVDDGYIKKKCQVCGVIFENRTKAMGHDFRVVEECIPTCGIEGWTAGDICNRCGETTCEKIFFEKHEFYYGICNHCGLNIELAMFRIGNGASFIVIPESDSILLNIVVPSFMSYKKVQNGKIEFTITNSGYGEVNMVYEDYIYRFIVQTV